jgi:hypothetical protein
VTVSASVAGLRARSYPMCRVQPGRFPDAIANARDKVRTSGPGPVRPDRVTTDDQGRYEWGQTFELISPTCSPFKKPRGSVQFSVAVGSSAVRSPLSPQSRRQEVFNASRVRFRVSVPEKANRRHIGKNEFTVTPSHRLYCWGRSPLGAVPDLLSGRSSSKTSEAQRESCLDRCTRQETAVDPLGPVRAATSCAGRTKRHYATLTRVTLDYTEPGATVG